MSKLDPSGFKLDLGEARAARAVGKRLVASARRELLEPKASAWSRAEGERFVASALFQPHHRCSSPYLSVIHSFILSVTPVFTIKSEWV